MRAYHLLLLLRYASDGGRSRYRRVAAGSGRASLELAVLSSRCCTAVSRRMSQVAGTLLSAVCTSIVDIVYHARTTTLSCALGRSLTATGASHDRRPGPVAIQERRPIAATITSRPDAACRSGRRVRPPPSRLAMRSLYPSAQHAVPIHRRQPVRLEQVHALALLGLVEGERLLRLQVVVELGQYQFAGTTPLNRGGRAMVTGTGRMRHATGSRVLRTRPGAQHAWTRPPHFARTWTALTRDSRGAGTAASIVRRSGATGARPATPRSRRRGGRPSTGCTIRWNSWSLS